ncbi:MAG: TetR/AcrR family transcriptional regulator [Deltaproteobacteria bacterium]|nr:TetR/AcrR family transcriptional regulator [Deltaproteobacteria bacterium]
MGRPSAREKLLDCAEQLFAEHGLGGVSLRAINAEAGLSPAALHYHFGTQKTLVESLLERQMPSLMERRRQLLDALNERPEPATTRDILDALIRPQVELLAEGGEPGLRYMRLIHRLQVDGDLDHGFVIDRWPGGVDRLVPLLAEANPSLPLPVLHLRLELTIAVMLRSLARGPAPGDGDLEAHVSALLDFLTGAFEAPITGEAS